MIFFVKFCYSLVLKKPNNEKCTLRVNMKGDYNNIYYNFFRGATNRNKSERLIFIKKYTYINSQYYFFSVRFFE